MIESSPRWVALALAAALTASPVLHAAAQTGAPVVPAATWDILLKKIEKEGVPVKGYDGKSAKGRVGPPDAAHTDFTATSAYDFDGVADVVADVTLIVVKFSPTGKAGEFKAQLWNIILGRTGKVIAAHSEEHIGSSATGYRKLSSLSLNEGDPAVKARLDEALQYWTTR